MSSRLTKTLACLGVLTCAVAVAPLGPATVAASARQPPSAEERLAAYDEALVALTQELSYLVLLGWVKEPVPDGARTLPAAIGIEPMDTADMVDALAYLDGQRGPAALQQLRAIGERVPTQVDQVLSPNVSVHAEDHPVIGAGVYLQAYDLLLGPWSQLVDAGIVPSVAVPPANGPTVTEPAPGPAVTLAAGTTATSATSATSATATIPATNPATNPATASATNPATTPATEAPLVSDDSSAGSAVPFALAGLAAGAVALVVALTLRSRRRAGRSRRGGAVGDEVLDAGRTIMAAVDVDGFGWAVAAQVTRLVGVPGGALVDGRPFAPSDRAFPDTATLERVLSTGREVRAHGATLVPVVAGGRVVGALVAWTDDHRAGEVLGVFAPLVGAALQGLRTRVEHEHLAFDDALTGVGNRRRFDRDLGELIGPAGRDRPVALAMVDIDHFKQVNDTHGHPVGDLVLRHVAAVIAANVRQGDLVYRYGGEEFAVLLPDAPLDDAWRVVERVRLAVAASPIVTDGAAGAPAVPAVTVSVGVSATPPVDAAAMVRLADGALYDAKTGGRNRVSCATGPSRCA